jgi:flagellar biogenesis protein FliO
MQINLGFGLAFLLTLVLIWTLSRLSQRIKRS